MKRVWYAGALLLTGCLGGPVEPMAEGDGEGAAVSEELSAYSDAVVSLRRDTRRCAAPLCGGWFARDVNRSAAEVYVSALDFGRTNFDEETRGDVLDAADGEVLVRGRLGTADARTGTRPLRVVEAWRGLPGVASRAGDVVYRVDRQAFCVGLPCQSWRATRMNVGTSAGFNELTGPAGAPALLDRAWALNEVYTRGALVRGRTQLARPWYTVLDASQIYLKLPQRARCVFPPLAPCPDGLTHTWERGLDRCFMARGCARPTGCEPVRAVCPDGWDARTWTGPGVCEQAVCEPSFVR